MHNNYFEALRQRLVDCRAAYRQTKDLYDLAKARATQDIQPQGKNAEERAVALTLALNEHDAYKEAHKALRAAETAVERAEANLESALDGRRAAEWQVRSKLADGLFRAGVDHDGQIDDEAFDATVDDLVDEYADFVAREIEGEPDDDSDFDEALAEEMRDEHSRQPVAPNGNALDQEDFPF